MSKLSFSHSPDPKSNHSSGKPHQNSSHSGIWMVLTLLGIGCVLSVALFFVYARSESGIKKNFIIMQEKGKTLTIDGCIQENLAMYQACQGLSQLCDKYVSETMKICLVNGEKNSQCAAYGDAVRGYNFGAEECKPYLSNRSLKRACADTYQAVADFCKAVRKI